MHDKQAQKLADDLQESALPGVCDVGMQSGEVSLFCTPDSLVECARILRDRSSYRFRMLVDIAGVDYPARSPRFQLVYHLLSLNHNRRVMVKVDVDASDPVPTVTELWPNALWYEREAWDMYGIFFAGNPDLRRILTDYGFEGHPQRKDFPLTGYVELRYDESQKRIVQAPVQLPQAFRDFDFTSPWEGQPWEGKPLPGDEKASK
ncbi:MAG: NADH-quinone oxidoreductase subunit C [Pseudomonadota bacterium]